MPLFSGLQISPPANWQDFETLCCDLWRSIWKDPNTQKNGRWGQPQHAVDICGRPNQEDSWAGVQCKGKDNYTNKSLAEKEVRDEVEKAKSFEPKLSQFIIATTGPKDTKIEELARKITQEHLRSSLFSVHIWGWGDVVNRLEDFPDLINKHYPGLSLNTKAFKKETDEIKETTQAILKSIADVKLSVSYLPKKIDTVSKINYPDISMIILTPEYQAELDHSRDLLNNYKPKEALEFLEKLKSRIWSSAQPIVKYRILTNIGSAKLWLDQNQDAARLFIKALQYNPEDEKALCNAALGYMLLGKIEEAKTFANKVLTKNSSSNRAYSIIIQTSLDDEKLEDIISKVPEPYRATKEVAHAIGFLARKRKKLNDSKKWLEIAVEKDKEDLPELKGTFGEILLELVIENQSTIYGIQLNDIQKDQFSKSIVLLTSAWDRVVDKDLRKLRLTWIVNRGIAKGLLGDLEGAIKDVETVLEVEPYNPIFIKYRAFFAYNSDDNEKAIKLLKGISFAKETPEATLLLAEVLRKENKPSEAISILIEFLQIELPKQIEEGVDRLLIQLYVDTKDFENARKISDSMQASDPINVSNLVDAARILRFSGKSADAISLLNEAKKYTIDSSSFRLLELADEFYSLEQFEDAANIYEKIVDKNLDTPLNHKLLNSYYRAGKIDKALKICQNLHQKYGPLKYISEMESAIYEEIGNLPEAKRICQEYLSLFPDDIGMKLRLAVVSFRSNDFEELDKFLEFPIDISILSLDSVFQLAHLYAARKLVKKSFEIMYETRRKFFNNGDAHLKYIGCFFQRERDVDEWLNISEVDVNTAVCIRDN
jgi:tetratricopeptide (TPR) repeat protein